ncbi:hypothetical protein NECAME_06903 [Necator americanus]|uniref:Uncharacterized protein n=1 Tax=Necator americanus TaxID=51031 RepID=W2TTA9_NECAM|nr:hypothetical protein NECAME_06903 [Necator americanus]ETN84341.1 hypothetical protein NECAME_06903 [Necator americanus]
MWCEREKEGKTKTMKEKQQLPRRGMHAILLTCIRKYQRFARENNDCKKGENQKSFEHHKL